MTIRLNVEGSSNLSSTAPHLAHFRAMITFSGPSAGRRHDYNEESSKFLTWF